jgi:hypothetical protein
MRNGAVQLQKIRGVEISPAWLMRVYVQQWLSVDVDEVDEVEEVQLKVARCSTPAELLLSHPSSRILNTKTRE